MPSPLLKCLRLPRPKVGWATGAWLLAAVLALAAMAQIPLAMPLLAAIRVAPRTTLVIPSGREQAATRFLEPILRAHFGPYSIEGLGMERSRIRIVLGVRPDSPPPADCELPPGTAVPGVVIVSHAENGGDVAPTAQRMQVGRLQFSAVVCLTPPEAARELGEWKSLLDGRPQDGIWERAPAPVVGSRNASDLGLLTPCIGAIGLEPRWGTALTLACAWLACVAVALAMPRREPVDRQGSGPQLARALVFAGLVVVGVGLRIVVAKYLAMDGDETHALPSSLVAVTSSHDSWVHPPLHRVIHQMWAFGISWESGDSLLTLRAVSVAADALGLIALGAGLAFRTRSWWSAIPFGLLALSPGVTFQDVLARPYALATAFGTLSFVALMDAGERCPGRARWLAALLAMGATLWTDLPIGCATALLVASAAAMEWARRRKGIFGTALVLLAIGAFGVPLVSGGVLAMRYQVHPQPIGGPDLRASAFTPKTLALRGANLGAWCLGLRKGNWLSVIFGMAGIAAVLWLAARARPAHPGSWRFALPFAALILASLLAYKVAVRQRNVLFLAHLTLGTISLAWTGGLRPTKPESAVQAAGE